MNGTMHVPERRSLADHLSAPHHHHGGHTFRPYRYPAVSYGPAFDFVDPAAVIQARNTCIQTSMVSPDIATTLRARGWRDDTMTRPNGTQVAVLCPPGVSPAAMLKGIPFSSRVANLGRLELGVTKATVRVQVVDFAGKPWKGVEIAAQTPKGSVDVFTDGNGTAVLDLVLDNPNDAVDIYADLPEGATKHTLNPGLDSSKVTIFQSSTPAPIPLVTLTEGVLFGVGSVMTAIGYAIDSAILQRFGELGIVAAVFTRIGRG